MEWVSRASVLLCRHIVASMRLTIHVHLDRVWSFISEQTSGLCAQRENSSRALDNLADTLSRTSWKPSAARLRLTSARGARATMKTSQTFLAQKAGLLVSLGFTSSDCTRARATSYGAWSGSGAATWVSPVSVSTTGQRLSDRNES